MQKSNKSCSKAATEYELKLVSKLLVFQTVGKAVIPNKMQASAIVSMLASVPSRPWFNSQLSPKNFRGKTVNVAEVNQRRFLEESGHENVDLVLASAKHCKKTSTLTTKLINFRFIEFFIPLSFV